MRVFFTQIRVFLIGLVLVIGIGPAVLGQQVVDKTVATVGDGIRTELITLSGLKWQLALQPGVPLSPPSSEDLNQALQTQIDQRLFALEAERLPSRPPTEKDVADKIQEILGYFPSSADFESRLRAVGFTSIRDDNFERMIFQRLAIERYLDFRFRSFVVVTPEDEENYYREVFVPDFRRRFPGLLMPTLDEKREEIRTELTEDRVAAEIEAFLDDARRRVEITILLPV
ncbi:MAG: hypothetical protein IPM21_04625 [Acidobacteria bacterium]|nr:hypothetical protein [Acidobacteriota bacterium]